MRGVTEIQSRLKELGINPGVVDGKLGPKTKAAIKAFQRLHRLVPDGIAGPKTQLQMWPVSIPDRDKTPFFPKPMFGPWPRQKNVRAFYGEVGKHQAKARIAYPMKIAWNTKTKVNSFTCHEKVVEPMERIFKDTLDHYGIDEIKRLRLDMFGGCLNVRKMRGGSNWSMHSWGIAVDLDPINNQLRWGRDRASFARGEYIPFWEIVEAQGAVSLGRVKNFDWMHFQFARL